MNIIFFVSLIAFRYISTVTQTEEYKIFPPFLLRNAAHISSCAAKFATLEQKEKPPANYFLVLYQFSTMPHPSAINFYSNSIIRTDNFTNISMMQPNNKSKSLTWVLDLGIFSAIPSYPIVVNQAQDVLKYKITYTCSNGSHGMDGRDEYRIYYLPCFLFANLLVMIILFCRVKRSNIRIFTLITFFFYLVAVLSQILTIFADRTSIDYDGTLNTFQILFVSGCLISLYRIICITYILTIVVRPALIEPDIKCNSNSFSFVCLLCNIIYQVIPLLIVFIFPYVSFNKISYVFWPSFALFIVEFIFILMKERKFIDTLRSKHFKRTTSFTIRVVIGTVFVVLGGNSSAVYFSMKSGGITMLTLTLCDTMDCLLMMLGMAAIFNFERARRYREERRKKRVAKKMSQPLLSYQSGENPQTNQGGACTTYTLNK